MAASGQTAGQAGAGRVPAWDGPTRLFKWSLVLLVALSWATNGGGDAWIVWHIRLGYAVLVLLVFRLLWGIVGSSTARFASWIVPPWTAVRYGYDLLRGRGRPYLGHNPLGSWMIIALLAIVGAQAASGLFTVDSNGIYGGPFANLDFGDPTEVQRAFSRYHHSAFNLLLGVVVVHVLVNLFYQFAKRDPVVAAMITGRKPVEPFADAPAMIPAPRQGLRAAACLAAAVAIVFGLVRVFGGQLT